MKHSPAPHGESKMGTPANGFRKPEMPNPQESMSMTIREAVTKYGDNWRLLYPDHHFIKREHMEQHTSDFWEARAMVRMERGQKSRVETFYEP